MIKSLILLTVQAKFSYDLQQVRVIDYVVFWRNLSRVLPNLETLLENKRTLNVGEEEEQ
jgi:hypothetical protein